MKYSNYIITDTTVWGQYHFAYDTKTKMRIIKKAELLHKNSYPFIDHYKIYALKPPNQKVPREKNKHFSLVMLIIMITLLGREKPNLLPG